MSLTFEQPTPPAAEAPRPVLRRELSLIDAAAFSTGIIGPVGAMALLGVGAAGILGRAAPWAFVFALVGVALVGYAFVRLSRYVSSAGSVYALVGITLGPRAGFLAGWALFGAYVAIGAGSGIEIGLFFSQFLSGVGIVHTTEWIVIAIIALGLVSLLAFAEIRMITRSLLVTELVGVVLVTLLSVVIIVRLLFGHGPHGQTFNLHFLALEHGTGIGTVASAAVFGFLAFAGFEGAAALGEETVNPAREIPRAIKIAIVVVGSFYLLTIVGQSLGYGTGAASITSFKNATSPYGELATAYVGPALADVLNLAASLSLFAILLATTAGAARILYALARDAGAKRGIVRLSRHGEPVVALGIVIAIVLGVMVGQRLGGSSVLNATFYALTIGTIALLVAYAMATLGAIRFLFLARTPRAPRWQIILPGAGTAFVLYTIYKNVIGVAFPYSRFPYIVAAWLVIGLGIVAFSPGLAARVTARLQASRGVVE
jgi:amino acid transporter